MPGRGITDRLTDGLANIFSSDDDLELQMGIGEDLDTAYQDAIDRAPDYVDDDTVEQRGQYGTLDPTDADVDLDDVLDGEYVIAGIKYEPDDPTETRKTSGSGAVYDEPGQDTDSLTQFDRLS